MHAIKDTLYYARSRLDEAGIESASLDASILLAHVLKLKREEVLLKVDEVLGNSQHVEFEQLISRRCKNEPIAYIIGKKEFWSLDFLVTRDTLIPRPDSETLIECALERAKKISYKHARPLSLLDIEVLDIGTGTACLLIALLKELPSARGLGVDISGEALNIAKQNAMMHGMNGRMRLKTNDWHNNLEKFDIILSNPPYIPAGEVAHLMKDVVQFEPHMALFSGEDGMDSYRAVSKGISGRLNPGGYVLLEVGRGQAKKVAGLLEEDGLTIDEIRNDLAGTPRCVIGKKN